MEARLTYRGAPPEDVFSNLLLKGSRILEREERLRRRQSQEMSYDPPTGIGDRLEDTAHLFSQEDSAGTSATPQYGSEETPKNKMLNWPSECLVYLMCTSFPKTNGVGQIDPICPISKKALQPAAVPARKKLLLVVSPRAFPSNCNLGTQSVQRIDQVVNLVIREARKQNRIGALRHWITQINLPGNHSRQSHASSRKGRREDACVLVSVTVSLEQWVLRIMTYCPQPEK